MVSLRVLSPLFVAAALVGIAEGFYLPGALPRDYATGDPVPMDVNTLSSVHTHLPFKYYSLPFCRPAVIEKPEGETIGEILMGDRIQRSPYEPFRMAVDVKCQVLCAPKSYTRKELDLFADRIKDEYSVHLLLDGLPVTVPNPDERSFTLGVPLGARDQTGTPILFNHYHFHVKYHETPNGRKQVVAFQAKPHSVVHTATSCGANFDPQRLEEFVALPHVSTVTWSYSVTWERSTERWATRWDAYMQAGDSDVRGWSILNSILIVCLLTGMVGLIMMRTLRKDIAAYNSVTEQDDLRDETGWKLVAKDVFRKPPAFGLLAAYAGSGVQLIGMTVSVLLFATLGFVSPASRGALVTALLLCFVFVGSYGGFTAARLMKSIAQPSWRNTILTATMVPGQIFVIFFAVNLAVWSHGSSAAVPLGTFVVLILLWFCVDVPFVFIGSVLGYKRDPISIPVPVGAIQRYIPPQPWYLQPFVTIPMGGVLPFGAVFIELFFLLTSVWLNRFHYVFGTLFVVFVILVVTCAEITVVMVYFALCAEDYRWWWRSFLTPGFSGVYLFLYSGCYFVYSLRITKLVPTLMYFGYMLAVSYAFAIITGTVGFLATFLFVRKIYGSIRIE